MKTFLTTSFLPVLFGAVFFIAPAFAQSPACDLQLHIIDADTGENIEDAAATALNSGTKTSHNAVIENGMLLHFSGMTESDHYRITITKAGYKRTIADHIMNCANQYDGVMYFVSMKKGSTKQTFYAKVRPAKAFKIATIPDTDSALPPPDVPAPPAPLPHPKVKIISQGVINGNAIRLAKPDIPQMARAVGASGTVRIQVVIDEEGKVISAVAVSGHPLLRSVSIDAAKASKFRPTLLEGVPIKISGIIVYTFQ